MRARLATLTLTYAGTHPTETRLEENQHSSVSTRLSSPLLITNPPVFQMEDISKQQS